MSGQTIQVTLPSLARSSLSTAGLIAQLEAMPPDAPFGTSILAMPISWKSRLQQYAGRLHREHVTKTDVRIIDFIGTGHLASLRMWDKRQRGYRAMGYRLTGRMFQPGSIV